MRPITLSELAGWVGAAGSFDAALRVIRVVTDSRAVQPGDLFVALRGERVDGHAYVAAAAAQGAGAAMVEHAVDAALPQLQVPSCLQAIGSIAMALRAERRTRVLALTGSNGKTSVKTLLDSILQRAGRSHANRGNHNNELGMPLALIEQPEDAEFAVYEMGAGQPGDIAYLAEIARPEVSLVNNIAPAHLERMGSLLGVARTKAAIHAYLPAHGVAVINADDAFANWMIDQLPASRPGVLRFALDGEGDVWADGCRAQPNGSSFSLHTPWGAAPVQLGWPGRHNLRNALAAASMAGAAGVRLEHIVEGLQQAEPVQGRLRQRQRIDGGWLIDDSYNANPGSLAAAIATLAASTAARRILVLGDMRELGAEAEALHAEVGRKAAASGIDGLWTTGALAAHAARAAGRIGRSFADQAAMIAALQSELAVDDLLLVKGSRGSRMERVANALCAAEEASHAA